MQYGAVAPVLQPDRPAGEAPAHPGPQLVTELAKPSGGTDRPMQASLFGPQEVHRKVAPPPRRATPPRAKHHQVAQQALDFDAAESAEPAVYNSAPVAVAIHRTIAAAVDISIVLLAIGVFLGTFQFAGHQIVLTKQTLPVYSAAAIIISLFYRFLFCIADSDTLGVNWTGLRLLNFDGRIPSRSERFSRTAGACISVIAIGIGFVWALVDEDRLTWHDYISKTFPSPRN